MPNQNLNKYLLERTRMINLPTVTTFLTASVLCLSLAESSMADLVNEDESSEALSIKITSCNELQAITQADGHYQLANDIDCNGMIFTPLVFPTQFSTTGNFTGVFDGNNFSIVNLEFSSASSMLGLFSSSYGAEFKNLTLENVTAYASSSYGNSKAAALVSNSNVTKFSNILVRNADLKANEMGAISAYSDVGDATSLNNLNVRNSRFTLTSIPIAGSYADSKVGGLFGYLGGLSTLTNSSAQISVNCEPNAQVNYLGGLVGETYKIYQSFSEINFDLNACNKVLFTGGIAGAAMEIRQVFAKGHIDAMNYQIQNAGGLMGLLEDSAYVYDAYSNVDIKYANGGRVGAAIGKTKYGKLTNVLAMDVNGYGDSEHCLVGETYSPRLQGDILCWNNSPVQYYRQSSFTSLDFFNIWSINEGLNMPTLKGFDGMLQLQ